MQLIRLILGRLILLFNWVFTPRSIQRAPDLQAAIDEQTSLLTLYQYQACPFCVKVRRAMKRQGLNIGTQDVKRSESAKAELLTGGGNLKVPCLKIQKTPDETQWLYESKDIIGYLEGRFAVNPMKITPAAN